MNHEFCRHIFEKHTNIKFHEKPFSGSRVGACKQTDRQQTDRNDETNSRFSQFRGKRWKCFMLFSILNATKDKNYLNLLVTARTTRPEFKKLRMLSTYFSYVPYVYHSRRWFFLHAALTGWSSYRKDNVFTAWYVMNFSKDRFSKVLKGSN